MAGSRIKGITVEIGGDTTGLDKALKSVNSTIKSTQSQLKDINKLLKLDPTNTELLSQKQGVLKEKIGATKEKLDALKTAQEQAKAQLENGDLGKDKYDALQREIIETEQELKNLIREAAEANTALNKIDAVGKKFEEVGGKMTAVGKGLTTHVTLPLVAVGAAGAKSFAEVDKTMQLTNKTMGNTEEQAEMLNSAMKEAAANSTFGMNDAATATLNFARAGLNAEQAAAALAPSMNLAAGEGGNLDTVSAGLVATINGFHGSFEDAGKYADVFAAACNNSALDVDSLSSAMSVAAPIFSAAGYNVNDAALYMGVMANNGIDADKAANSLKTGLARLVSPAKEGAEKMAELGISVTNADGTMKDSVTIQRELHEAFGKLSESEQIAAASAIFGKNQMAPWLALINTAPGDVDALNDSLENCAGTTEEMAQAMMSGFGGSLEKLKSSIDVLMTSIGEALAPTIQKVADVVQKLVDKFNALTPAQQETIVKIGLVAAAIGPALVVFGKLTTGIGKAMQAFSTIGKGVLAFVGNAKAGVGVAGKFAGALAGIGPIGWIIIAVVAAMTAAFVHLWKNNEEFRNKIIAIWNSVKEKFSAMAQKITDLINSLGFNFSDLGEAISAAWDWLCNALEPLVTAVLQSIGDSLESIIDVVGGVIQIVVGLIKGFKDGDWSGFLSGISDLFTGVINSLLIPFRAIFSLFGIEIGKFDGDWGKLWENIKFVFVTIWNAIKDFFVGIWEGLKNIVVTVGTAIGTAVSAVWTAVSGFFTEIWNGISGFFIGIWEGLKTAVETVVLAIFTAVSTTWETIKSVCETVWNAIAAFFTTILEGLHTAFSAAWNAIKSVVTTVVNAIRTTVQTVWNAIKTFFTTVLNTIKQLFTTAWNAIKQTVTTVVNGIKTTVSTVWNAISTTISTVLNSIKSSVSTIWNGIKSTVSNVVNGIKSTVSTAFNAVKSTVSNIFSGIKNTATSVWNSIKTAITTPIEAAKNTVKSVIDKIKGFFNFSWSLPKLKLPHVSIKGSFSLTPPSVPHFSIDWYKEGGIMTKPTMFGLNGSSLMAGGEAGAEAILPLKGFYDQLSSMLDKKLNTAGMEKYLAIIADNSSKGIYLEDGTLVGHLLPAIDSGLGKAQKLNRRLSL